ncbi:MAG: ABC transporter permease [Treponema sp.]|jgi:ABC-type dipeptide/oligopeptide/nickel transport system permease component|nr:ABC transporter permease [Treponema sp.]
MGFIGKRLITTLLTLFLVSLLSFAAFRVIPGDAALLALGVEAEEEQIAALRREWGLDRSVAVQYGSWLVKFLTGNLGNSTRFQGASISGMILDRLPVTLNLALLSLFFIVLIALPCSLLGTKNEASPADRILNTATAMTISAPGFFLGVLFIWVFGLVFKLFVPGAYVGYRDDYGAFLGYLLFPALAVALPNAGILVKFLRSSIFREFKSDYVRTARSKGSSRRRCLFRHVFKNACLPALTLMGMILGEIFTGSIVIEQIFSIPGIGRLLLTAITSRDFLVMETLAVYTALIVVLANTLVDIGIQIIDPRIRIK